ncbi:MAG: DUF4367 domain-containing protein [Candidatus Saccharibacteria bacterium]|nr:DUF4367 domain-containing protein [Candidatus Saccharibacteria bacterium]
MGTHNRQDVIEINGKKYDALTGKLISGGVSNVETILPTKAMQKKNGVVMDGFMRKPQSHKTLNASREVHAHTKSVQKSHTLMRNAVKKPQASAKPVNTSPITKPSLKPSPVRQQVAASTQKSNLVSHYGDLQHRSSVVKKLQPLSVKKPLQHAPAITQMQVAQSQAVVNHNQPAHSRSHATSVLIEKALAGAKAHEQVQLPKVSKKRRRIAHKLGVSSRAMAISTSVLAGVLLGGFFAIQNVPNLSMRVAAARAGFNASMPGYNPSGFSFKGPINYSPGQVTISFKSNTDDRAYTVSQKASGWNSDALLSNYVVAENKQYQTYLDRGRTLYIYDGSNATWVDNGVWYQVEGNSDMTTDQLVRIAASI